MLHRGGKDDLRAGAAKVLELADEQVQLLGGAKHHLNKHGIVPGDAAAFHHVGAGGDVGIEFHLLAGLHLQIDEGFDKVPQGTGGQLCVVPQDKPCLFQAVYARRNGGRGEEHLVRDDLQRRSGVLLQKVENLRINLVHVTKTPSLFRLLRILPHVMQKV
ncbi:hypothetical protein SDC9_83762 [bioreactor metagenome]|uniref:Uncharacterized protein n=1 Tax=bioreactor metagenome TaxID=1076179 RepID=A0A644Z8F1_9ZZZZ